jgi:hypothetical protein
LARSDPTAPPRKVHGPRLDGAQTRPIVGKARGLEEKPPSRKNRKNLPPAKDEVERSERYVRKNGQGAGGGLTNHQTKVRRAMELKRLLEPINASLLQVQSDIAHDKKVHPAIRLDAADRLLNRLHGKPTEKVEISDPADEEVSHDEVKTLLNRILESVGAPLLEFHDDVEAQEAQRASPDEKAA